MFINGFHQPEHDHAFIVTTVNTVENRETILAQLFVYLALSRMLVNRLELGWKHRWIWLGRLIFTLYKIFGGTLCSHCNVTLVPFSTYFLTTRRTSTSVCPSEIIMKMKCENYL